MAAMRGHGLVLSAAVASAGLLAGVPAVGVLAATVAAGGPTTTIVKLSHGFFTNAPSPGSGITCALGLHGLSGLVCAWPRAACSKPGQATGRWCYDGRGALVLLTSGRTRLLSPGNDLLLDVDGDYPGDRDAFATARRQRPLLVAGAVWAHGAFRCIRHAATLTCRVRQHGFPHEHGFRLIRGRIALV